MKSKELQKVLIIQTAFIGDVVLATPIIEALSKAFPLAKIDFLLRKGNESLFHNHPKLNRLYIWDKKQDKNRNLFRIIGEIRNEKYDAVINAQRFFSSGLITLFSGAKNRIGFDKNPLSFSFDTKILHDISKDGTQHETERNMQLIGDFVEESKVETKLYPSDDDYERVRKYKTEDYIVIAASSVWFTKQFPKEKWIDFVAALKSKYKIYFLGGPGDKQYADEIIHESKASKCVNLCGELSMLESAALMKDALMNYVNDSAPMHFASAINAPTCAIYCSTIPAFGFGPTATNSHIIEVKEKLDCRPCGLHGKKECPEGHFKCALNIKTDQLIGVLK